MNFVELGQLEWGKMWGQMGIFFERSSENSKTLEKKASTSYSIAVSSVYRSQSLETEQCWTSSESTCVCE